MRKTERAATFQTYDLALGIPAVFIGRCIDCKRPFRVEIPAEIADRFGARLKNAIGAALPAAGISPPSCDCRAGVRCTESPLGLPECGDSHCDGHGRTYVKFAIVKTTYKPEETCGGSCWTAKSTNCTCSCRGKNHGGAHAISSGRF